MRALIRSFDHLVRRAADVFEFSDREDCLLRLQVAAAPRHLELSDGTTVRTGDPVLLLHLWNEHVPPMRLPGPDLAWAAKVHRMFFASAEAAAAWLVNQPALAEARAVGGATVLIALAGERGGKRLMRRLGFDVFPYRRPLGRFGEFWENFYTWGLMWAFNAVSLRHKGLLRLRRSEVWISMQKFLEQYRP